MPYRVNALDSKIVRQIRIAHLMDGESCKFIAKAFGVSDACVSRLCRWLSHSDSDQDLRYISRTTHRGGGARPGTESYFNEKVSRMLNVGPTCRQCIHINDHGCCGLGFPECLTSNYQEATKCNAYVAIND